jgi:filamentous hemagglutinin family protein
MTNEMSMPRALLRFSSLVGCFFGLQSFASAQIATDGSVGPARTLSGSIVEIGADLGRQSGGNLFHSFSRFNVSTGQIAFFSGPASVGNIIGRVTGGSPSSIDGTIASTIAGANLFLFNPSGMAFGPGAQINVSGSFHASTANYLRFTDGVRFEAAGGGGSSFTTAAPAAFGFLNANPAAISVNGSVLGVLGGNALSFVGGPLSISNGAFLFALDGGGINLAALSSPGEAILDGGRFEVGGGARLANVSVSASSAFVRDGGPGAITVRGADLVLDAGLLNAFADNSRSVPIDVRLSGDLTAVNASGIGAGQFTAGGTGTPGTVTISTRNVRFVDSSLLSTNFGASRGGDVVVNATEAIELTSVAADGFANITSQAAGSGRAGDVAVAAPRIELTGRGALISARGAISDVGSGGNITVVVDRLVLRDGAAIAANALRGTGASAGSIRIDAAQSILLTGFFLIQGDGFVVPSGSALNTSSVSGTAGDLIVNTPDLRLEGGELSSLTSRGQGGNIVLNVGRLTMTDNGRRGAAISSDVGPNLEDLPRTGNAGNVVIVAREAVVVADNPLQAFASDPSSGFIASSISSSNTGSGRPGSVTISAPSLEMSARTAISAITTASGAAGSIGVNADKVAVRDDAVMSVVSGPDATGDAGSISIVANTMSMTGGGFLSSTTAGAGRGGNISVTARDALDISGRGQSGGTFSGSGIYSRTRGTQAGGTISANAGRIDISEGGTINAGSSGASDAGRIALAANAISIRNGGTVSTEASAGGGGDIAIRAGRLFHVSNAQVTTSVAGGTGSGGNITIDPDFVVLNNARIQANAFGGDGGNITIVAGQFLSSPGTVVEASSELGISGTIAIQAPESNVTGSLAELSGKFFDASTVRREGCSGPARAERQPSSLVASGRGGLPPDGSEQRPAGYFAGRDTARAPLATAPVRAGADAKPVLRITCR